MPDIMSFGSIILAMPMMIMTMITALCNNAEFWEHHLSHACDDNDDDHYALSNNAEFWEHHFSHACDENDDDYYALSNNAEFWEHHFSHACDDNDDYHYALSSNAEFWEHHFSHSGATNNHFCIMYTLSFKEFGTIFRPAELVGPRPLNYDKWSIWTFVKPVDVLFTKSRGYSI